MNRIGWLVLALCVTAGCSRYDVIPDRIEKQVNREVTFDQIKQSPSTHQGQLVVMGGQVLSATRREDKTSLEVLQLPLTDDLMPANERAKSTGRFVAIDHGKEVGMAGLDPAVVKEGVPVTVVGEVVGQTTVKIGEAEQEVPKLRIVDLTVWDKDRWERDNAYYSGYGYGPGYGYWGAYPYRYGYYY
ncbi:MAG: Slp family lipoprotein [Nitrospiraceae bacterium]